MKRPDLVRQLQALEVPIDVTPDDLLPDEASAKLRIDTIAETIETSAFTLSSGATGYMISLSLTVMRSPLAIAGFELSVPWPTKYMTWLPDPADGNGPRNSYQFPGRNAPEFPREMVINHRANARRNLRAGTYIEGLLLGYGFESIPDCYRHNSYVVGTLAIIDQFGVRHSAEITLWIDRSAKRRAESKNAAPRGSLFAKPDRRAAS
jgi:hypothetical protein